MNGQADEATALRNMAYHYEPYWNEARGQYLKTVLLFFDGVAVTVPDYMKDAPLLADPVIAQPLAEQGLLVQLSPEHLLDEVAAETIASAVEDMLAAGAFEHVGRHRGFAALSMSRLGHSANAQLVNALIEKLQKRGLARPSEDGRSVPLHPIVRAFILTLLPQLLREQAEQEGYALHPTTTSRELVEALADLLDKQPMPTAGHVVAADLQQVTLDLSSIPLDEVLDFRRTHGADYRAYARNLRRFIREVSVLDVQARDQAMADRREELADAADKLFRTSRRAWNRPLLQVSLGIAGGAVSLASGNLPAAGIAAASALAGFKRQADPGSSYSYLFQAHKELSGRGA